MCTISDRIKFCSCGGDEVDIEELNHYWRLYRFSTSKDLEILGLVMVPELNLSPEYTLNEATLERVLNDGDAFDKEFDFKEKDRLVIVLNNHQKKGIPTMEYTFEYNAGQWDSVEDEKPFYLENNFDEIDGGALKDDE